MVLHEDILERTPLQRESLHFWGPLPQKV